MLWINLPRYVAVVPCDSIYRSSKHQQEKPISSNVDLVQSKVEITFRTYTCVCSMQLWFKRFWLYACVNPTSFGDLSDRKLIVVLQCIHRDFGRKAIESGISCFLPNRKNFFRIYLIALTAPLVVGSIIGSSTGEMSWGSHISLVDVFGNIFYPEFENDSHIFREKLAWSWKQCQHTIVRWRR